MPKTNDQICRAIFSGYLPSHSVAKYIYLISPFKKHHCHPGGFPLTMQNKNMENCFLSQYRKRRYQIIGDVVFFVRVLNCCKQKSYNNNSG